MKKFLKKVLSAADPRAKIVRADLLNRLDNVQKGLGAQAVDYVVTGEGETVLASLTALAGKTQLDVGSGWSHHNGTADRRRMLAQQAPEAALHVRYARVLAAATATLPDHVTGTAVVAAPLRVLFAETFAGVGMMSNSWPRRAPKPEALKFTPTHALAVVEALEGTPTDFFDLAYHNLNRWESFEGTLWRETYPLKDVALARPDAFVAAGPRLPARSRADMMGDLAAWGLVGQAPFTAFVLDQAGNSAKAAREAAASALKTADAATVEGAAIERLQTGNAATRAGMVDLLAGIGSDTALAALEAQRGVEKAARVLSQIENRLMVHQQTAAADDADDATGYTAIDGSRVEVPPPKPLPTADFAPLGARERAEVEAMIDAANAAIDKSNKDRTGPYAYRQSKLKKSIIAKGALELMNAPEGYYSGQTSTFLGFDTAARIWARDQLARMPLGHALKVSVKAAHGGIATGGWTPEDPFHTFVSTFLGSEDGDMRHIDAAWVAARHEVRIGPWDKPMNRKAETGDLLRTFLSDTYWAPDPADFPHHALWPFVASSFDVLDTALGLAPNAVVPMNKVAAVQFLRMLPKTPMRYMGALLEIATGITKGGRAEARAMLADAPGVTDRLIDLLGDARQAVRAGAAEWLGERGDEAAVKPLKARLKKEKSDVARAAMLTALDRLGQDMADYLGPKALLAEAEKGLAKAKFDKLDWLRLDAIPGGTYRNGRAVPQEVLRWWIFLAFKLKQPGGNTLFDIYLDQLAPEAAEAFSTWLLDAWVSYDTARPGAEDAEAYAAKHAPQRYQYSKRWMGDDYTQEQAHAELYREFMSNYLNSGAATKGLLGLAKKATPTVAADRARAYLKNHGSRTSQASALLEMLAAKGDAVSLQVVIMAATRLKQKGVQKFAGELVQKVADEKGWTMDELSDRTIPVAGLNDDGVLDLPCGVRTFTATLDDDFKLQVFNPDGKLVKALPSGDDEATKASKKQLTASKKELKQIVQMQSMRLYEALCAEREWTFEDWQRDFRDHPVMKRLTERVVWLGVDGDAVTAFRPTPEGDCTDVEDGPVDPATFPVIRLAHGALVDDDQAWIAHLEDYEVPALFTQFGRPLLKLPEDHGDLTITDRKGWVTDTFTVRGAASRLGYERGEALDGGFFCEYVKTFRSAGLKAVIEFSGNCLPEENVPAALVSLSFQTDGRGRGGPVRMDKVPPVLLSECWNDYHDMAAKAAFDPEWERKMPW